MVSGAGFHSEDRKAMIIVKQGNSGTERLFGAADKRKRNGRQFGKRRKAHGLSLIGVERAGRYATPWN